MPIEFKLPNLGEGIKSADVAGISVKEGDVIEPNQNVLELATDKAVVELPCPTGGKLLQIHVKEGQTVSPGALLFTLEGVAAEAAPPKSASSPAAKSAAKPAAAPSPQKTETPSKPTASPAASGGTQVFNCPNLGEGIKSAGVASISVKVGDVIAANQSVMELETDKAVVDLPCSIAGQITKIHVNTGATIQPGAPLLTLSVSVAAPAQVTPTPQTGPGQSTTPGKAPANPTPAAPKSAVEPTSPAAVAVAPIASPEALVPSSEKPAPAPAGPATRRLARQLSVDLYQVSGSGPGGRITMDDVQAYVRQIMEGSKTAPNAPVAAKSKVAAPPLPDFSKFGSIDRKAMTRIGKVTAANLSYAWQTIPHVTQHDLADVTELEAGRKRHTQNQKTGAKITMTVLAIKAVVAALKQYPAFNSSIDTETEEIVYKQYYHVGVAVDTEFGLVVPVIRDVNHKSILEIASELDSLAAKARERKLSPADFQGGTFTITNLGGIGGTTFSPIVNWPEVAILGMSRAKQQLVVTDGEPKVRLMLPLSLSYDHRVINGADAARFITKVSGLLADPSQLLIES